MSKVAYYWERSNFTSIIAVDKEAGVVHIYDDVVGDWCDDDWSCDLKQGREWYRGWRKSFGEPVSCSLPDDVDIHDINEM
jgi:hypothetical protein